MCPEPCEQFNSKGNHIPVWEYCQTLFTSIYLPKWLFQIKERLCRDYTEFSSGPMGGEAPHFKPLLLLTQGLSEKQQTPHQHSYSLLPAPLWNSCSLHTSCRIPSSFCDPFTCQTLKFLLAFSTFRSPSCRSSPISPQGLHLAQSS